MISERTSQLRRYILAALKTYNRPCSLDDLLCSPELLALHPTREELLVEWNALETYKYTEFAEGSNGEYCKITDNGLLQINKEAELKLNIWGRHALK